MLPKKIKVIHALTLTDFEEKLNEVLIGNPNIQPISQVFEYQSALGMVVAEFTPPVELTEAQSVTKEDKIKESK